MTGLLHIVGLGPGNPELVTPQAMDLLASATDVFGYTPYVARVADRTGLRKHPSDNREEKARARAALAAAAEGRRAVIVSSGDPGVFAMAAAVFEELEGEPAWQGLDISVTPGVTAMLAAAAAAGAPLGHDFCVINLSDNLKSWELIAARLRSAVAADFAIAIYNPRSKARPDTFANALALIDAEGGGDRLVVLVRNATLPDEHVTTRRVRELDPQDVDMRTLVIVGSTSTRRVGKWVYTPRRGS